MTDFTMKTDADGVAVITWDVQAKSMNVMSTEAFALLSDLVDQVTFLCQRNEGVRRHEATAQVVPSQ